MEEIADYCYQQIKAQSKRPLFVAVTGDSGSGKSYLVGFLVQRLLKKNDNFTVINHDDFLISRSDREPMKSIHYQKGVYKGKSHWEILENMFRLDEYRKVIQDLKANKGTSYYPYSRNTGRVTNKLRQVDPKDFMIFDTSMMLDEMDFVILLDVDQENIIKRKIDRDKDIRNPEEIKEMHQKVQGYFWVNRGKPETADIVIDNNALSHPAIK